MVMQNDSELGNETMFTSGIVPDSMVGELHGICVLRFLKVLISMSTHVPSTSYVATY